MRTSDGHHLLAGSRENDAAAMRTGDDPAAGRFLIKWRTPHSCSVQAPVDCRAAAARVRIARCKSPDSGRFQRRHWRATADEDGHYCFAVALWANAIKRAGISQSPRKWPSLLRLVGFAGGALRAWDFRPDRFRPDPCASICNALHCHALQMEKADGGASREDEDDAAAAARTGAARVASRRCRPALAGGATTSGEAGRRPRPGSRARRVEMDRIGLRV